MRRVEFARARRSAQARLQRLRILTRQFGGHARGDFRIVAQRQDVAARRANGGELVDALDGAFSAVTLAEIAPRLDAEEMIWAPVLTAAEAIVDPQAIAAGAIVQTPQHEGPPLNAPGAPIRFPGADDGPKGPAPKMGEHTRAVLAQLGYSETEIDALFESGAAA
jgi:crotonobetainyl-CoA:carnitine CoA-transferase CaiB-like acyl-CoA transferase